MRDITPKQLDLLGRMVDLEGDKMVYSLLSSMTTRASRGCPVASALLLLWEREQDHGGLPEVVRTEAASRVMVMLEELAEMELERVA